MDEYSPMYYPRTTSVDPAFIRPYTSAKKFPTYEQAEEYGIITFDSDFAGVKQVSWAEIELPF